MFEAWASLRLRFLSDFRVVSGFRALSFVGILEFKLSGWF